MDVWLWDVGEHARGVADSAFKARRAARDQLRDGEAARVEKAIVILAFCHLTSGYFRTGTGWTGRAAAGRVSWSRLPPP